VLSGRQSRGNSRLRKGGTEDGQGTGPFLMSGTKAAAALTQGKGRPYFDHSKPLGKAKKQRDPIFYEQKKSSGKGNR